MLLGHGAFFTKEGAQITPTTQDILATQQHFLTTLGAASDFKSASFLEQGAPQDPVLANAQRLAPLIRDVKPENWTSMEQVNLALAHHYQTSILERSADTLPPLLLDPPPPGRYTDDGLLTVGQHLSTTAGGDAYVQQCKNQKVPIPSTMRMNRNQQIHNSTNPPPADKWINWGEIQSEFESSNTLAQLWSWSSAEPGKEGICLALPRWKDNEAQLFGLICLGYRSGKVCYFDNPEGTSFKNDQVGLTINSFVGGYDLQANGQGICSDCHAGENPFVVHNERLVRETSGTVEVYPPPDMGDMGLSPDMDFFLRGVDRNLNPFFLLNQSVGSIRADVWPDPIVHPNWPQNPGPLPLLAPPVNPDQKSCTGCHAGPGAQRFPLVSTRLAGYCGAVLTNAMEGAAFERTMPSALERSSYAEHIQELRRLCALPPIGQFVSTQALPDDPNVLSPPVIIGPLYACTEGITVQGARLDARVDLYVNGSQVDSKLVTENGSVGFTFGLQAGMKVTAKQAVAGVRSGFSNEVEVRNYQQDYPNGLPKPVIDPGLAHQCGQRIAARHVPGATIRVKTTPGGEVDNFPEGSSPHTVSWATAPFGVETKIEVMQTICGVPSDYSDPTFTRGAPTTLPTPVPVPSPSFPGQQAFEFSNLVHSSRLNVRNPSGSLLFGGDSWPFSTQGFTLTSPMAPQSQVTQRLCNVQSPPRVMTFVPTCQGYLQPPQVVPPFRDQNTLKIIKPVPGARIQVTVSGVEIGDGTGPLLGLTRKLRAGETLLISQKVGSECVSTGSYSIQVQP